MNSYSFADIWFFVVISPVSLVFFFWSIRIRAQFARRLGVSFWSNQSKYYSQKEKKEGRVFAWIITLVVVVNIILDLWQKRNVQ